MTVGSGESYRIKCAYSRRSNGIVLVGPFRQPTELNSNGGSTLPP